MSAENAEKLVAALKSNESLSDTLKKAGAGGFEQATADAGYSCTPEEFATALQKAVVKADAAGESAFVATDGIVSGISSGVSGHVSAVGSGIA